jgi:hypothetical protein
MGQMTQARIKAWQEHAGLTEATGRYEAELRKLSQAAFELIKIVELERSGIRDGDGAWHGGDVIGHTMHEMIELCESVFALATTGANDVAPQSVSPQQVTLNITHEEREPKVLQLHIIGGAQEEPRG